MTTNPSGESPRSVAEAVLARIESSGYGTPRPDRYTPTFGVDEVQALAEAVLSDSGSSAAGGESK